VIYPDLPARMADLPRDSRGYPVPWFVAFIDGVPDFRVIEPEKIADAIRFEKCWVCGRQRGRNSAFVIGPMCAVNRNSGEPPCHQDCAEFSARNCPFLVRPKMKRNDKDLPAGEAAGIMIRRNPGVTLVWTSRNWKAYRAPAGHEGNSGVLFNIGDPVEVKWYREGRAATRAEVVESIDSGLPILREMAEKEGVAAVMELQRLYHRVQPLIPAAP
jgi:hypothetical protein